MTSKQQSIAVLLPSYLGDAINAIPAIKLLKESYSDHHFYIIARPGIADVFKRETALGEVVLDGRYDKEDRMSMWEFSQRFKQRGCQVGILFRNSLGDALVFKMAGISKVIGYKANGRSWLLNESIKLDRNRHYIHRYAHLVNATHGKQFNQIPTAELACEPSNAFDRKAGTTYVGVYFGGQNKGPRHYPLEFAQKSLELIAQQHNVQFLLLGDAKEKSDNQDLADELTDVSVENLSGKTSITGLVDVIADVDVLITIDSGPMHIAAVVNTPYLAVVGFGTSPWSIVAPKQGIGEAIVANGFSITDEDIVKEITPAQVAEGFNRLLVKSQSTP